MLAPTRPPTISNPPIPNAPAHHHREVIALYCWRTLFEDAALIDPPHPCIHSHYHWSALQSLGQLATTAHFVVVVEVVVFVGVGGLALEGTRVVDGAQVGIVLIRRDAVIFEVVLDIFG